MHGLQGVDDGRHRPRRHELRDLAHEASDPRRGVLAGADIVLQDDLLGGMIEAQVGQPTPMRPGPSTARMNPPMTEQEGLQLLPRLGQGTGSGGARSHQIAHRLVGGIGNPHGCQLAGPVQRRQGRGITAVGLDPVAWTPRDQGRRHHDTMAAEVGELPVQAVPHGPAS